MGTLDPSVSVYQVADPLHPAGLSCFLQHICKSFLEFFFVVVVAVL